MDLSPYGFYWTLDPEKMTTPVPDMYYTNFVKRTGNKLEFYDAKGNPIVVLDKTERIGGGSYGTSYKAAQQYMGHDIAIKIIARDASYTTKAVITEAIAQIIVQEESKAKKYESIGLEGPYAPKFFLFGKDDTNYYLVSEYIGTRFDSIINTRTDINILKKYFIQIAIILNFLYDKLEFNHRDFKPDNIMISTSGSIKIIDYGFSYMKYKGLVIQPEYSFPKSLTKGFSQSRDLNSLFFWLLHVTDFQYVDCDLKRIIKIIICSNKREPDRWRNTYTLYNQRDPDMNVHPVVIMRLFSKVEFSTSTYDATVTPEWSSELREINSCIMGMIKDAELNHLNPLVVKTYLERFRNNDHIRRFLYKTTNKEIRKICLRLLGMPDNTAGGRRKKMRTRKRKLPKKSN